MEAEGLTAKIQIEYVLLHHEYAYIYEMLVGYKDVDVNPDPGSHPYQYSPDTHPQPLTGHNRYLPTRLITHILPRDQ